MRKFQLPLLLVGRLAARTPECGAVGDRSRMRDPQGDMSESEGVDSSQSPNNQYATQAPLLFGD